MIKNIVDTILCKQILIPIFSMVVYMLIVIYFLSVIDLWRCDQIKNSIVWFFSVALISMFEINNIKDSPNYFKDTLKNNLKVIVIIQFIISVYTFSLPLEIVFVPFMVFLAMMIAVSTSSKEHKIVEVALNKLLEYIGIGIIIFTIYKLFTEFSTIYQEKTFYDFVVPTLLSILFLPFLFLLSVYIHYKNTFVSLSIFIDNEKLLKYAKFKAFKSFIFNTSALRRWFKKVAHDKLQNKNEVDDSINYIFSIIDRESSPIDVDIKKGWSPYQAIKYLKEEGIEAGHYQELYDGEWFASSPLKELDNGIFSNNIAYYIDGTFDVVKILKIKLNINNLKYENQDMIYFITIIGILCYKALNVELSSNLRNALTGKILPYEEVIAPTTCKIEKDTNLNNSGYSIKFTIENNT
ncbi:hypothetical protein [Bathymodiolus thermophilus thioautotrophic gill symbiont]|nr:hypothetical protein [Bathymodiolus thermophilus thioautotrophic gill symbiont]